MARQGSTRSFRCPPDHKHGETPTCYTHGCGCDDCRHAHAADMKKRRKLIAYGRYQPVRVEAGPTLARLAGLRAAGWTIAQIAEASGLNDSHVQTLINEPHGFLFRSTRDAIDRIGARPAKRGAGYIDATGTRRRLQALARLGHSWAAIGEATGLASGHAHMLARNDTGCTAATAATVARGYETLAQVIPPDGYARSRAANPAIRYGWFLPFDWVGLDIDDPAVTPPPVPAERAAWKVDELAHLRGLGESPHQAAAAIGDDTLTLARLARRHGRADIARWLGETSRKAA